MNTTSLFIIIAYAIVLFYFVKDTEYTKMFRINICNRYPYLSNKK